MEIRIGAVGVARSPLSPSGIVEVDGRRLDARSDGGYIEPGSRVVVLGGDPTGYVVRLVDPGRPPPDVPRRGEPVRRAEARRTRAEVAAADRGEEAERRLRRRRGLRYGTAAAGSLGAAVGLGSGCPGWLAGWADLPDGAALAAFLGGSAAAGAAAGVVLFFLTGGVGAVLGVADGEPVFAPDFSAVFAALLGAATGFWWQFGGDDPGTVASWAAAGAAVAGGIAYLLGWVGRRVLTAAAG